MEAELNYADEVVSLYGARRPKTDRAQRLLRWQLACLDLHVGQVTARLEWVRSTKKELGRRDEDSEAGSI